MNEQPISTRIALVCITIKNIFNYDTKRGLVLTSEREELINTLSEQYQVKSQTIKNIICNYG